MAALTLRYEEDISEVKADLKDLLGKFNTMTGGQKAWFGLAAILGMILGAIASAITIVVTFGASLKSH